MPTCCVAGFRRPETTLILVFPGIGNLSSEQEEILGLREENKRLRQEKEILKKATSFFAREGN